MTHWAYFMQRGITSLRKVWISIGVAFVMVSCSSSLPDKDKPWSLILAQAPTHDSAVKMAERISSSDSMLDNAMAVSIRGVAGGVVHLVLSRGASNHSEIEKLKKSLSKKMDVRLRELDLRKVEILGADDAVDGFAPEGSEDLVRMAELLPNPGDDKLINFSIITTKQGKTSGIPRIPVGTNLKRMAAFFRGERFSVVGLAQYSSVDKKENATIFVGFLDSTSPGFGSVELMRIYSFLLDYKIKRIADVHEKRKKAHKKKRRRVKRKKEVKNKNHTRGKSILKNIDAKDVKTVDGEIPLADVLRELPDAIDMEISSKKLKVYELAGINFKKKNQSIWPGEKISTLDAWCWLDEDSGSVVLWLFDSNSLVERLSRPCSILDRVGLALSSWVSAIWESVPEVSMESEQLEYISFQLVGAVGKSSCGYVDKEKRTKRWQISWVRFPSDMDAKKYFEKAFVSPRQRIIKKLLNAKNAVDYDLGLTLHEVGDVEAWLLTGVNRGRLQELYFNRGRYVWSATAGMPGHGGLNSDELIGRVELLRIWESSADKKPSEN